MDNRSSSSRRERAPGVIGQPRVAAPARWRRGVQVTPCTWPISPRALSGSPDVDAAGPRGAGTGRGSRPPVSPPAHAARPHERSSSSTMAGMGHDRATPPATAAALARLGVDDEELSSMMRLGSTGNGDQPVAVQDAREGIASALGVPTEELSGLTEASTITAFARLTALGQRYMDDAMVDELTGALRRGIGIHAARREVERSHRLDQPLVIAMIDVDGLKFVNDQRGHQAGDEILCRVVGALRSQMRTYDLVIRYGGTSSSVPCPELTWRVRRLDSADFAAGSKPRLGRRSAWVWPLANRLTRWKRWSAGPTLRCTRGVAGPLLRHCRVMSSVMISRWAKRRRPATA